MAKLLLTCDDYVYSFNGIFYAESCERYEFYQRYLRVFDELRLVTRCVYETGFKPGWVELNSNRIEYVPVPSFSGPAQYAKQFFRIGKVLRHITDGCDAAVLRLPSTVGQRVCSKVMRVGIPYATEIVFDAKDGYKNEHNLISKILWYIIHRQMQIACYKALGVSCVTEHYLQQNYYSRVKDAFSSYYSSLSLDKNFYSGARKYPTRDTFIVSLVANQVEFNGRKGCNEVIKALSILKDRGVNVHVNFIGRDYHNGIHLLSGLAESLGVRNMLTFVGYANRKQLSEYLDSSDIYVMPTRAEGLPRVIIEAMAKGLPCITTPVSGNPELISSHFLVNYEDVETLAERIEELIKDKSLYESASAENFNRSLQYEASILEKRRDAFYSKLKACIK